MTKKHGYHKIQQAILRRDYQLFAELITDLELGYKSFDLTMRCPRGNTLGELAQFARFDFLNILKLAGPDGAPILDIARITIPRLAFFTLTYKSELALRNFMGFEEGHRVDWNATGLRVVTDMTGNGIGITIIPKPAGTVYANKSIVAV